MDSHPIIASNLVKRYGGIIAVNGIDFKVSRGECFGFLGPNGAGKTSTMKMISCVSPISSGSLLVSGLDVTHNRREIKKTLGVVSQADSIDPGLDVFQNLISFARYHDLPKELAVSNTLDVLNFFGLEKYVKSTPDELSGGMRRRLLIARALLHQPSLLVLDEPTTGLDPHGRRLVWERLNYLKAQDITILLSTHYMEEAAYLCDRLVMMDKGQILAEGEPTNLIKDHAGEYIYEVQPSIGNTQNLIRDLSAIGKEVINNGYSISVFGAHSENSMDPDLFAGCQVKYRPSNLEDVFLKLTGKGLENL